MKILVVLSRVPFPLEKGDKLRAYHQIRLLSRNHEIYLFALSGNREDACAEKELAPFCKKVVIHKLPLITRILQTIRFFFKGLPLQCGWFYSRAAKKRLDAFISEIKPDHIYCQLVRTAEYVKSSDIPKTIDYQDVLSKGMSRRAERAPWYLKTLFRMEQHRLATYEENVFSYFDNKTIITGVDRDLIPHPQHDNIHVIANGVDFEKFCYNGEPKEYELIFTGNMSYAPNVDAAEYIVNQLFPKLRELFPTLTVVLAGANPSRRVLALRQNGVIVTGWVDSMAEYYAKSKIFLAPMHFGTGLQNKLLEAMAMRLPCITSPLAAMPLQNITDGKEIIVCHTVTGYVDAVALLLNNPEKYAEISANGYNFVKDNYNWETMTAKLERVITALSR